VRYCPSCLEEYEDRVDACAECDVALVTEEELAGRPEFRRLRDDDDPRTFVVAGCAENPFDADALIAAVGEAGIPVLARVRNVSAADRLVDPVRGSWWDLLVPADQHLKAAEAIARRREELAALEADASMAAEEEALALETQAK